VERLPVVGGIASNGVSSKSDGRPRLFRPVLAPDGEAHRLGDPIGEHAKRIANLGLGPAEIG